MTTSSPPPTPMLSEQLIQDAFHSYLKSSLTQAKLERLLDADVLSGAEADLMIAGPALCLYFAALRCKTNPPSVPLPRTLRQLPSSSSPSPSPSTQLVNLSADNCPPTFAPFLRVWSHTVPSIQSLPDQDQHNLARIICGLSPTTGSTTDPSLYRIAAELRAVALDISQRRSFQDRYAEDLQAALDSGSTTSSHQRVSFVPPPMYEPSPSTGLAPSQTPTFKSSLLKVGLPPYLGNGLRPPPSPTLISPSSSPSIEFIRETLYAALGDTLEEHPSLRELLTTDPPRAYFASVSLAILFVSTHSIDHSTRSIIGVLGFPLTLEQCSPSLQPLMTELIGIGKQAQAMMEEDSQVAIKCVQRGRNFPSETMMDRAKKILLYGPEYEHWGPDAGGGGEGGRSVEGRALTFTNRIGRLALAFTGLSGFRERQEMVFQVLAAIGR